MTDLLLWIGQVVLALGFLAFGYTHAFGFERTSTRPRTLWMADVGRDNLRIIGILEILGAVGLILPTATGVLPWLTPVAATALAILMVFAIVFHLRRPGESANAGFNAILGILAAAVAIGRFVVAAL
jgi:putative oxidoreductase